MIKNEHKKRPLLPLSPGDAITAAPDMQPPVAQLHLSCSPSDLTGTGPGGTCPEGFLSTGWPAALESWSLWPQSLQPWSLWN